MNLTKLLKIKQKNMEKFNEFIEKNNLKWEILSYFNGHEATKGCKSGKDNINPYALIFDKEKEEKYYILELSNNNYTLISSLMKILMLLKNIIHHGLWLKMVML